LNTGTNSPSSAISLNYSNNKKTNNIINNNKKVTRSKSDLSSQSSNTDRKRIHPNSSLFLHNNNSSDSSDNNTNSFLNHKKKIPLSPITEVSTPLLSEAANNSLNNYFDTSNESATKNFGDISKRHSKSMETIHSSQMPAEKLSLTRGMAVDKIVKRLSSTERLSPPSLQILQAGGFSYTNPSLKSKSLSSSHPIPIESDIVYAQVVCNEAINADGSKSIQSKETVHDKIKASRQSATPSPMLHRTKNKQTDKLIFDDLKNDFVATAKSPPLEPVNGRISPYRNTIKLETDNEHDEVDNSAGESIIKPVNIRNHIPRHSSNSNLNQINYQQYHLDSEFDHLNEMREAETSGVDASLSSRRKILESRIKSRIHGLQLNNSNDNHQYHSNIRKSTSPPPPTTTTLYNNYNKYGGSNDIMNRYSVEGNHEHTTTTSSSLNYVNESCSTLPKTKATALFLQPKNEKGDSGIEADTNVMMKNNRRLNTSRFNIGSIIAIVNNVYE
jgi:hypothetical protein